LAVAFCVLLLSVRVGTSHADDVPNVVPVVPDEATAIKIAAAVWLPQFGDGIQDYRPYRARLLKDNFWRVEGTLHHSPDEHVKGGVPIAEISKAAGCVRLVAHGK
jgi:hypothetical protein